MFIEYINECVLIGSILIMALCLKKLSQLFKGIETEEELDEKLSDDENTQVIVNGIVFVICLCMAVYSFYQLM